MNRSAVILAAGKGVRMNSSLPKVLHKVAGKPMILHIIGAVKKAGINNITVVIGQGREAVEQVLTAVDVNLAIQEQQLGTGHALMQAEKYIEPHDTMLVLAGDTPLLQAATIKNLIAYHQQAQADATILSAILDNPYGYGRIIRNDNASINIVEEKDANEKEKAIREINTGMYCFEADAVFAALKHISPNNAQGEYYLTDVLGILSDNNKKVEVYVCQDREDIYGINNRVQLSEAEAIMRRRKARELMETGVTIIDPQSTFIDSQVEIGRDTIILPFTLIEGHTVIGENCEIGPLTRINDATIGSNVVIENSRIKAAIIGDNCSIGPYSYLRPETVLHQNVKIGDFVEIKKSVIGEKSKVLHLSYVGDSQVGKEVNIGAGTITCNYDGTQKHQTILEDGVFIGSNTNLVAPVKIGKNAYTGAGSTITRDIPEGYLGVERAKQRNLKKWNKRKSEDN